MKSPAETPQKMQYVAFRDDHGSFRSLIETLQVGVIIQSASTEILLSNPKALELLGLTEQQLLGKTSLDPDWNVIHEDGTPFPGQTHPASQAIATGQPVRDVVMGIYRPTLGDRVWLLVNAEPQCDLNTGARQVTVTFTDITASRRAEAERRKAAERLRIAVRSSNVGLWDWDILTNKVVYSREWKSQLGYDDGEIESDFKEWEIRVHPDDIQKTLEKLQAYLAGMNEEHIVEFRMRHKDGSWRWIYSRAEAIRDSNGKPISMLGCHIDVTQQRKKDEELKASKARLEFLSRQLIREHETELHHLARELHDEFGQVLTAMKMNLQEIRREADEPIRARVQTNISMIDQVVQQVREITLNLRPPQLDTLGLVAALHWFLKHQAEIVGFQERLSVNPPDLRVSPELAIVCYRIAQEAVTNSIKHAKPRCIEIELLQEDGILHLIIRDDGPGFEISEVGTRKSNEGSFGLISMRERAELANGQCEIHSKVGSGTTVHACLPISENTFLQSD